MKSFVPVMWLWTLPHRYPRPWIWMSFVAFLAVFVFLRWDEWFIAAIYARLIVEFVLCWLDFKRLQARHRRERREQTRVHLANCPRCTSLQTRVAKNTRAIRWSFSC